MHRLPRCNQTVSRNYRVSQPCKKVHIYSMKISKTDKPGKLLSVMLVRSRNAPGTVKDACLAPGLIPVSLLTCNLLGEVPVDCCGVLEAMTSSGAHMVT